MIAHSALVVTNYEVAKKFYSALLAPLDYKLYMDVPEYNAFGFLEGKHSSFWLAIKEKSAETHVAFLASTKEAVEAFHKAGLAAGGTDNGAPGYRTDYSPGYYAAFIYDADHNNVEAVWYDEVKEAEAKK